MKHPTPPFPRPALLYLGAIECIHMVMILRSGAHLLRKGEIGLLAPPPPSGWPAGASHFLLGLGAVDFLVALIAMLFVWGALRDKKWSLPLGNAVLTAIAYSGLIFAIGTGPTGAWSQSPLTYWGMVALYTPIACLTLRTWRIAFTSREG